MGDNGLSNADLPAFKRKPGWDGPVGEAQKLHQTYLNKLDEWGRYQKNHGDKIQLWDTTRKIISKSRRTDGISTQHLYDALGVQDYHDEQDTGWVYTDGLTAALELGEDTEMKDLAKQAGSVNEGESFDNEFIRFGREIVTRRAAIELAAHRLIDYLKYGNKRDFGPFPTINTGIAEKGHPDLDVTNEFYMDFITYDLPDQVVIAKELTYGLSNSQRGKDFLANLFEYQRFAIFDPFAFVDLPVYQYADKSFYSAEDATEQAKYNLTSVFAKNPESFRDTYLTADNRVKIEASPDVQSDSFGEHLVQLLTQLYPGLIHFHSTRTSDVHYMDNVVEGRIDANQGHPDPDAIVSEFTKGVLDRFVNDEIVRQAIDDTDWSNAPYDKPDWSSDHLDPGQGQQGWTSAETQKIAKISVANADALVDALELSGGRWIAPYKMLFTTAGAVAGYTSLFSPGSAPLDKQISDLRAIGKGLTDLSMLERYLPEEYADEIAQFSYQGKLVNMGHKAAKILGRFGVVLDVLGTILYAIDMAQEMENGDYDAAGGYALLGLSGVAGIGAWGAGFLAGAEGIGFATTATLGLVSGGLVVIALVLAALGTAVLAWCDESAITEWLRFTRFGNGWSGLTQADVLDPEQQTFRYRKLTEDPEDPLGEPDFVRQVSALHSMVRPIGLTSADVGTDARDGHSGDYPWGSIVIEPYEEGVWGEQSAVDIVDDGLLFVRPCRVLKDTEEDDPPYRVSKAVSGEYLHRISLRDEPGESDPESTVSATVDSEWKTALGEHEPNPFVDFLERYTETDISESDLDLAIDAAQKTDTDDGESAVTFWRATLWAMAGDGADVFGWSPPDVKSVEGTETYYLEVIYAPPKIASWMRDQSAEINPQSLPTVTCERLAIENVDIANLESKTSEYGGGRP